MQNIKISTFSGAIKKTVTHIFPKMCVTAFSLTLKYIISIILGRHSRLFLKRLDKMTCIIKSYSKSNIRYCKIRIAQ